MTEQQTDQRAQLSHQIELLIPVALTNEHRAAKLDRLCDLPTDLLTTLDPAELAQLVTASTCSPWLLDTVAQSPQIITECIANGRFTTPLNAGDLLSEVSAAAQQATEPGQLKQALRRISRREKIIIAWRDLNQLADLEDNLYHLSQLAQILTTVGLEWLRQRLTKNHGTPISDSTEQPATYTLLALGKLGGGELNFHSDIDLIPLYSDQGETNGNKKISNQEFFTQLTRDLVDLLQNQTSEGIIYQVDLRLRPFGDSGALTSSHNSMITYYSSHGREWERYALIKARPLAGDLNLGYQLLADLSPFVYRRYLDYGVFESLRELKQAIDQQIERKSGPFHVKLGRGGIREIEFITQVFQLLNGGRDSRLQQPQILKTLPLLQQRGDLTADQLQTLLAGYQFLRRSEHRIQMLNHRQLHTLPTTTADQQQLACAMCEISYEQFLQNLHQVTAAISSIFNNLLASTEADSSDSLNSQISRLWSQPLNPDEVIPILQQLGFDDPQASFQGLTGLQKSQPLRLASAEAEQRVHRLVPLLINSAAAQLNNSAALLGAIKFLQSIIRRSAYISLLIENPQALDQLCSLCAAGERITSWLCEHPVVLDELLDHRSLNRRPDYPTLAAQFNHIINPQADYATSSNQADPAELDLEQQMNQLRDLRSGSLLRAAILDIGEQASSEGLLTDTAELVLDSCLQMSWQHLANKHGPPIENSRPFLPKILVIGYGKLGAKTLSYGSDLDLVLLQPDVDDEAETLGEHPVTNHRFYNRVVQRFIHLLTTQTTSGKLYEIDFRLRPSGNSGPIVTPTSSFERYLREDARIWELQALVHARPVAGDPALKQIFLKLRQQALCQPRKSAELSSEILQMADRIRQEKPARTLPDKLKLSPGGMVDIEFCSQYLVLRHAADFVQLTRPTTTIKILQVAADCRLINHTDCQQLIEHYQLLSETRTRWELGQPTPPIAEEPDQWSGVHGLVVKIINDL